MKVFRTKKFIGVDYDVCMEQATEFLFNFQGAEVINFESKFTGICEVRLYYYYEV